MENSEKERLIKAMIVLKAARFISHPYAGIALNSYEYADAIEVLVKLSGDNTIKEKATQYAGKWEERLKEKARKDSEKSSKSNNNGKGLKILGKAILAVTALGVVGAASYSVGKNKRKKTGE